MYAPPAGRGRHMVLPAWMTRGTAATNGGAPAAAAAAAAAAGGPVAAAAPPAAAVAPAAAAPLPAMGASPAAAAPANGVPSTGAGAPSPGPSVGGPLGKWMRERSPPVRTDSREREDGARDRDRDRDRNRDRERDRERDRDRDRDRDRRRRSRSPRRNSRSPRRAPRDRDNGRRRSSSRDRHLDEGLSASMLADRLVEARQMPVRKREENRDVFLKWLCPKDHSFCLDFEEVKGGKHQVNLYECRHSKLTRVYTFRDSEELTKEKVTFEEFKRTRIFQKAYKYFTRKGVPENAKLVYHDYLNDPEIVVG